MKDKLKQLKKQIELVVESSIDTPSRKRPLTYARAVFCKVGREQLGLTYSELGDALKRDHATVMHSIRVVFPFAMQESRFQTLYEVLVEEYQVKRKRPAKRISDAAQRKLTVIQQLREENAFMKERIKVGDKFYGLVDDLNAEELDEIYEKLNLFVKVAIKNRVYN